MDTGHVTPPPDATAARLESIDHQHQDLFALIHRFYGLRHDELDYRSLLHLSNEIVELTLEHFLAEERLLKETGHSAFAAHRDAHRRIGDELVQFLRTLPAQQPVDSFQIVHAMDPLLLHHLRDDQIFQHWRGNGASLAEGEGDTAPPRGELPAVDAAGHAWHR